MADGIMRNIILDETGSTGEAPPIKVMSAGTHAVDGSSASKYAVMTTAQHDIDISSHKARKLSEEMVNTADVILTMERNNTNDIIRTWPHITTVHELKRFGRETGKNESGAEIQDPIGMDINVYGYVFDELQKEIVRISPIIFSLAKKKSGNQ